MIWELICNALVLFSHILLVTDNISRLTSYLQLGDWIVPLMIQYKHRSEHDDSTPTFHQARGRVDHLIGPIHPRTGVAIIFMELGEGGL